MDLRIRLLEKEQSLAEIVDSCKVYEQINTTSRFVSLSSKMEQLNKNFYD